MSVARLEIVVPRPDDDEVQAHLITEMLVTVGAMAHELGDEIDADVSVQMSFDQSDPFAVVPHENEPYLDADED